jgi:hypothetical protein
MTISSFLYTECNIACPKRERERESEGGGVVLEVERRRLMI